MSIIAKRVSSLVWQLLILGLILLSTGCYSFRGIDIDPESSTYEVIQFRSNALNAPPTLAQTFTEELKEKIRTETRLEYSDTDPDITFEGIVVDFRVTSEAPAPGEFTALNRLTIVTAITYSDTNNDDKNWKNNFSYFFDFPSTTDLASVQDQAIEDIVNQINEDIFNRAFTNW